MAVFIRGGERRSEGGGVPSCAANEERAAAARGMAEQQGLEGIPELQQDP